jgi:hypothetical protein
MKVCLKNVDNVITSKQIKVIKEFVNFIQTQLPLKNDVNINLLRDRNVKMTTGVRYPKGNLFILFGNRLLIDVLRTLSHEWAHCYDHQKLKIKDRKEVGGKAEDFANEKSGEITKKFIKSHPKLHKKIFN